MSDRLPCAREAFPASPAPLRRDRRSAPRWAHDDGGAHRARWLMPAIKKSTGGPYQRIQVVGFIGGLQQHEIAVALGHEVDDLLIRVAFAAAARAPRRADRGRDRHPNHRSTDSGRRGSGAPSPEPSRATLQFRIFQELIRTGGSRNGRRVNDANTRQNGASRQYGDKQVGKGDLRPHCWMSSMTAMSSSTWRFVVMGPTCLWRILPSASITKVSGTP